MLLFLRVLFFALLFGCPLATAEAPHHRDGRQLGLGLTEGTVGFEASFAKAKDIGIQFVELPQQWDELELQPGVFSNTYLDIANTFYAAQNIKLVLSINPVDTGNSRLPSDLKGLKFDDQKMIGRFQKFSSYVLSRLPDVELAACVIGNEIDVYLGTDEEKWRQYGVFLEACSGHMKKIRPGLSVGTKLTVNAIHIAGADQVKAINAHTDFAGFTYYPLTQSFEVKPMPAIFKELDAALSLFESKPVYLLETGYPAAQSLNSSEQMQALYIKELFKFWDDHIEQMPFINLVWLHDLPTDEVDMLQRYYRLKHKSFADFISSLGLCHVDGKAKPAYEALRNAVQQRAWKAKTP